MLQSLYVQLKTTTYDTDHGQTEAIVIFSLKTLRLSIAWAPLRFGRLRGLLPDFARFGLSDYPICEMEFYCRHDLLSHNEVMTHRCI